MVLVQFKKCTKCQGDLLSDGDEWRCLQCGRYYYPPNTQLHPEPGCYGENSEVGNVNVRIEGHRRALVSWWERNKKIIACIDRGMSNKDIAKEVRRSPDTISKIRVELVENRASASE
ncbi:MAG: hypothetical protein O3C23_02110 [bacterium]|nr:hypothetical protein [bacterium]